MTDPEKSAAVSQTNANANPPSVTANGEHEEPKEIVAQKVSGTGKFFPGTLKHRNLFNTWKGSLVGEAAPKAHLNLADGSLIWGEEWFCFAIFV